MMQVTLCIYLYDARISENVTRNREMKKKSFGFLVNFGYNLTVYSGKKIQREPKSILSGRLGHPYGRPGDSFRIRETPG